MVALSNIDIVAVVSASAAVVALCYTVLQFKTTGEWHQIRIFEDVHGRMQKIRKMYEDISDDATEREIKDLFDYTVNELEYYAFVSNRKFLKDKQMREFYDSMFRQVYEELEAQNFDVSIYGESRKKIEDMRKIVYGRKDRSS